MSIEKTLAALVGEANKRIRDDPSLQQILKPYIKRRLILSIEGQANYLFKITPEGVNLETKRKMVPKPTDMYIKMSENRSKRLIQQRRLRLADLPFIKHRNITIREVKLARKLYKKYLSQPNRPYRTKEQ